jgi:hypothetical protein
MEETVTQDLRRREATIRKGEAAARKELREAREKLDIAQEADIEAFALALIDGQGTPAATARKLADRVKDIEARQLPGFDEALWLLAEEAVSKLGSELDEESQRQLKLQSIGQRWVPPRRHADPHNVLPEQRGPRRPDDVVGHVARAVEIVKKDRERRAYEAEREERRQAAYRAVSLAQDADLEAQRRHFEETRKSLVAVFDPQPFDRHAWLKSHGLLADYQYVQPRDGANHRHGRSIPDGTVTEANYVPPAEPALASTEA